MTNQSNGKVCQNSVFTPLDSISIGVVGSYSWKRINDQFRVHIDEYEALADDESRIKHVYALYGLAVFKACVFESGLKNMILYSEGFQGKIRDMNRAHKAVDRLTMGQLIDRLKKNVAMDQETEKIVRVTLRKRNYLAHKFWERRSHFMATDAGTKVLSIELVRSCQLFEHADFLMEPAMKFYLNQLAKHQGITPRQLDIQLESMMKELLDDSH